MSLPKQLLILLCTVNILSAQTYWKHREHQGQSGACHAFSLLGLVEAELYKTTGKYTDLSERDLLTQHLIGNFNTVDAMINHHLHEAAKRPIPKLYLEGASIQSDFKILKRNGVALESRAKFNPTFSMSMTQALDTLRLSRNRVTSQAQTLKHQRTANPSSLNNIITEQKKFLKRAGITKYFSQKKSFPNRPRIRQFLQNYDLVSLPTNTSSHSKKIILKQLPTQPVAVDVKNYASLTKATSTQGTAHRYHSLIIAAYHPESDSFSIRCSANFSPTGKPLKTSGKTLPKIPARLVLPKIYKIHHLKRK